MKITYESGSAETSRDNIFIQLLHWSALSKGLTVEGSIIKPNGERKTVVVGVEGCPR